MTTFRMERQGLGTLLTRPWLRSPAGHYLPTRAKIPPRADSYFITRSCFRYRATAGCFSPTLVSRSWILLVSWIFVYSPVMRTVLWPAIFEASILDPPASCHHVILARRKECGDLVNRIRRVASSRFSAGLSPEYYVESPRPMFRGKTCS